MVKSDAKGADPAIVGSSIEAKELFPWIQLPLMSHCEILIMVDVDAAGGTEEGGIEINIHHLEVLSIIARVAFLSLFFGNITMDRERSKN